MAEPLKNRYGPEVPRRIAAMISRVHPRFPAQAFLRDVLEGYAKLELMDRGRRIAEALRRHLPQDFGQALSILLESVGPADKVDGEGGMASFLYLPHTIFVARHGLDDFEASMAAQHQLTQRFTAEWSIRPFIEAHPQAALARLREWARDPSPHVRRLVSEGTRPRLPWAPRLRAFQADPSPVLELLELLKDDPELYVRRSVANNLNDIGKDNPGILHETARRWLRDADENRRWLVRHALRSAVKRGEPGALAVLGFGGKAAISMKRVSIAPARVRVGGAVSIAFEIANSGRRVERVLVDLRVFFVKARAQSAAKVFKLRELVLRPGESARLEKKVSLRQMTTRKHYAGRHRVEVLVNGAARPLGAFVVT